MKSVLPPRGAMPVITVIVSVYNGVATLQQCIDSVCNQTYAHKELIVIDGGSTDGSADLIKANSGALAYWVSEPDRGIYSAWNKGLAKASGDWVCFIGSDDFLWGHDVLQRLAVRLLQTPSEINVVYGQIMLLSQSGDELFRMGAPWAQVKTRFRQLMSLPHPAVMHRKNLFAQHGNFDESYRIAGDYEMLLRELRSKEALFVPDIVVTGMRQGGISSNPGNNVRALNEVRAAQRKNGLHTPGLQWRITMARAYIGLILSKLLGIKNTRILLNAARRIIGLLGSVK
jgi:glycosyltransferase involved in cell wall biosynthesis